jgi:Cu(I)/Ag(I) efflux system membrane fusion protein
MKNFFLKNKRYSIINEQLAIVNRLSGKAGSIFANCLLQIACCLLLIVIPACHEKKNEANVSKTQKVPDVYTCPMHPQIIRNEPGRCPICGMELVKKEIGGKKANEVGLESLVKPTNEFVVSSVPVMAIQKREEQIEINSLGSITYDTRLIGTISAKVSGRIEKLYVRYRYQHVHKGDRIMDVYSPELVTAEQDLLFLLKNDPGNHLLIEAAKQKLLLLGMDTGQLNTVVTTGKALLYVAVYSNYTGHVHETGNMEMNLNNAQGKMDISQLTNELPLKEGMYVQKGQPVFQINNMEKSWVLLNIFPESQALIKPGNAVRIVPETAPEKDFRATINFIEPFYRKDSKTFTARVYFDNSRLMIPVGSQVRATIFGNTKDAWWLPKAAVLSLGMDDVVFKKYDDGFIAHKIKTGISYKNYIQVLSGLDKTDSVATNAQFLMDSESFIKVPAD